MIQEVTGDPREVVIDRLLAEHRQVSFNIKREFAKSGLTPHVWSEGLIDFYRTTDCYTYNTPVWNRTALKCRFRAWIGRFILRHELKDRKILIYGDGMGFDSAYLAKLGCDISTVEPSEEGGRFAKLVYERNEVGVNVITDESTIQPGSYDLIVCLDVLEHLPHPERTVTLFSDWTKAGGFLISHSPFYYLNDCQPTHLKANQKYSGNVSLFRDAGFELFEGRLFWTPIAVKKASCTKQTWRKLPLQIGAPLLSVGRVWPSVHNWAAMMVSRVDPKWSAELISLKQQSTALEAV